MAVRGYIDGRGRQRYAVEFEQGGKRIHRRCPPGVTQAQARELEVRLRRELFDRDSLDHQPEVPLAAAIQLWLDSTLPHRKDQTVKNKAHQWAELVVGKTVRDAPSVAAAGCKKWTAAGLSVATTNRRLCTLKACLKYIYQQGMIAENLSPRIRLLPGEKKREVYLTPQQVEALAKCAPSPTTRSAILLSAYTGLRAGELLKLCKQPTDGDTLTVSDTKNGKPRSIPVIDKISPHLSALPIPLTYRQLVGEFWVARKKAGMEHVRWHDLRHSFASLLINQGVDIFVVGRLLGHRSTQTSSRYAHMAQETLRAAMAKIDVPSTSITPRSRLQRVK